MSVLTARADQRDDAMSAIESQNDGGEAFTANHRFKISRILHLKPNIVLAQSAEHKKIEYPFSNNFTVSAKRSAL